LTVHKSSIVINGVSLTINNVYPDKFEVSLSPRTMLSTTLGQLSTGTIVNIEIDQIAKYVYQFINKESN
jgi:riboflavin synthase